MIDAELLKSLRCPETRQELRVAESALVERVNQQVAAGSLKNRAGEPVKEKLSGGLVRADGKLVYPLFDGLPVLLVEEGIPLER